MLGMHRGKESSVQTSGTGKHWVNQFEWVSVESFGATYREFALIMAAELCVKRMTEISLTCYA